MKKFILATLVMMSAQASWSQNTDSGQLQAALREVQSAQQQLSSIQSRLQHIISLQGQPRNRLFTGKSERNVQSSEDCSRNITILMREAESEAQTVCVGAGFRSCPVTSTKMTEVPHNSNNNVKVCILTAIAVGS